jgi:hypothetical protein
MGIGDGGNLGGGNGGGGQHGGTYGGIDGGGGFGGKTATFGVYTDIGFSNICVSLDVGIKDSTKLDFMGTTLSPYGTIGGATGQ